MTVAEAPAKAPANPWDRWSWVISSLWLVFLVYPVRETFHVDVPVAARVATLAVLAAFAVLYVLGFSAWDEHALLIGGALLVLTLATVPVIGIEAVGMTPFLGAYSALAIPEPWWRWTTAFTAVLPLLSLAGGDFPMFFFLMVWPIIALCTVVRLFVGMGIRAQETRSEMALVAERDRVARDVHDVLGHSLTALSIKAELAARLIDVDPERARAELVSIQETARQALSEVRATVGGLRAGNLDAEVETAPRVLADAGVETTVRGEVADTDPRHRALLAWVLRESVTNVVRHAAARRVVVDLGPHGITVTDDGAGISGREGNGLRGMRERVADAGGTLTVGDASPGTRVRVDLP